MKTISFKIEYKCICGWKHVTDIDVSNYKHNPEKPPRCMVCGKTVKICEYIKTEHTPDSPEVIKMKLEAVDEN